MRAGRESAYDKISRLQSENVSLHHLLKQYEKEFTHARSVQENSNARIHDLEQRLEESVSTLFRLRPQRLQCTETEVKDDYHSLTQSIKTWVEANCGDFLDDNDLGFEVFQQERPGGSNCSQAFHILLDKVSQQPGRWNEIKDNILAALIMRYLVDLVLRSQFPVWLQDGHWDFLHDLENSMDTLEPKRGKFKVL